MDGSVLHDSQADLQQLGRQALLEDADAAYFSAGQKAARSRLTRVAQSHAQLGKAKKVAADRLHAKSFEEIKRAFSSGSTPMMLRLIRQYRQEQGALFHHRACPVAVTMTRGKGQRWGLELNQSPGFEFEVLRAFASGAGSKCGVSAGDFIMKVDGVVVRGGDDGRGSDYAPNSAGRAFEILEDEGVLQVNLKVCYSRITNLLFIYLFFTNL